MANSQRFRLAADGGGAFADLAAFDEAGGLPLLDKTLYQKEQPGKANLLQVLVDARNVAADARPVEGAGDNRRRQRDVWLQQARRAVVQHTENLRNALPPHDRRRPEPPAEAAGSARAL